MLQIVVLFYEMAILKKDAVFSVLSVLVFYLLLSIRGAFWEDL